MQSQSLTDLAAEQLSVARTASSGRAAHTVYGGHSRDLRQTLIALAAGHGLGEHQAPGEATLQVLEGTVRMTAGDESWTGHPGDHLPVPPVRHDLMAETDAVVLLTVATRA
jgi:quercetin dioxygenase-like cupin family protein